MREFWFLVVKVYMASLGDKLSIVYGFLAIREEFSHLLFASHKKLPVCIFHTVRIRYNLSRLKAKKQIVCIGIIGVCVMNVVGCHKRNVKFL